MKCRQGNIQVEGDRSTVRWRLEGGYEKWFWNVQHSDWRWWLYQAVFRWLEGQPQTCRYIVIVHAYVCFMRCLTFLHLQINIAILQCCSWPYPCFDKLALC